ncbi:MAG: C40 family peptidase [Lachnospiraceae bacterium]|nr:C40 family peptidase [Lachnospiraceae bacterium]
MLCQPIRILAAETDVNAQTQIQSEVETKEEHSTVQSVLDGMSVGIDAMIGMDSVAVGEDSEFDEKDTEADDEIKDSDSTEDSDTVSGIADALGEPIGISSLVEADKSREEYAKAYEDAKNANWGYTNLGIANVDNNLNIRAVAAEDGRLVGKLPKDAACEIIDSDGTWAHIKSGNVEGYASCDYLITGVAAKHRAEELVSTIATVTTDTLKVRAEANTDSEVITMVPNGEQLEVVESEGEWVKVYLDDQEVYVYADYVEVDAKLNTAITMTELLYGQGVSDVRVDLCQYAKEFLGNPYVWGGTSLTKGADCSGFVLSVFKKFGVSLPHYSGSQANCGTKISLSEAKPGDLVFYGNGKRINHVAIYIGGGQVIHASSPKTGIKISNATYRTPIKVVRILYD